MKGYSLYCLIYAIQNSHYLWRRDAHSNLSISMKIFRKLGVRLILIPRSTLVPGGQTVPFKRSSCSEVLLVHSYSYDHCFRCRTQFQAKATTASAEICLFRSNSGNPTASDHCFLPRTKSRVSFSRFCPRNATVLPRRCLPRNLISTLVAAQHAELYAMPAPGCNVVLWKVVRAASMFGFETLWWRYA